MFHPRYLLIAMSVSAIAIPLLFSFQNCSPKILNSNLEQSSVSSQIVDTGRVSSELYTKKTSVIPQLINVSRAQQIDNVTPACTDAVLKGWKCLVTRITNLEGQVYKVGIRWSRPNVDSSGSVIMAVGGAGVGESRNDPPSKLMMDRITETDKLRYIEIEFLDAKSAAPNNWGGYFVHAGGYRAAGSAFAAVIEFVVSQQIVRGQFLNYLGGSNGSTVAAYAMSHFGIDKYFDRVVFQMGPFLPRLSSACDPNSASSFKQNTLDQQNSVRSLIGSWRYDDVNRDVCSDLSDDRISILGTSLNFPNTHVHVIIGGLEEFNGFGKWIFNSNLEWYNSISAKSKNRIIRPEMSHQNSYKDMRRYLKLSPNETAVDDIDYIDQETETCVSNKIVKRNCRASAQITAPTGDSRIAWTNIGNNCFELKTEVACGSAAPTTSFGPFVIGPTSPTAKQPNVVGSSPAAAACQNNTGQFIDPSQRTIQYMCSCGVTPVGSGWVAQKDGCFHRVVALAPVVAVTCQYSIGEFINADNRAVDWACGCANPPSGSGWVPQVGNCFHRLR